MVIIQFLMPAHWIAKGYLLTHVLHVWNIYQHLPQKLPSHVGKYSSTMEHLGGAIFRKSQNLRDADRPWYWGMGFRGRAQLRPCSGAEKRCNAPGSQSNFWLSFGGNFGLVPRPSKYREKDIF